MSFETISANITEYTSAGIDYPMTTAGGVALVKHADTLSTQAGTYAEVGALTPHQPLGETNGQVNEAVAVCGAGMIGLMGILLCATYFTNNRQR